MRMYAMHIAQNPTRNVQAMHELLVLQTVLPRTCTQNKKHIVVNELESVNYIFKGEHGVTMVPALICWIHCDRKSLRRTRRSLGWSLIMDILKLQNMQYAGE